jgi:hypothetical protein
MISKVVLDNKRRGSFGPDFKPGDVFLREVDGEKVTFRKLALVEAPLARARKVKGRWVGAAAIEYSREDIIRSIREDRESR